MEHFYRNFEWPKPKMEIPALVRTRNIQLPGHKRAHHFEVCLQNWLLEVTFDSDTESVRFPDCQEWILRKADEILLVAPNTKFSLINDVSLRRRGLMFQFIGGEKCGLNTLLQNGRCIISDPERKVIRILTEIADTAASCCDADYWGLHAKFYAALAALHDLLKQEKALELSGFADNVDNLMKRELTRQLSRQEISRALGISVSQLSHRYKAERGISPIKKHLSMRIERAASLLLTGSTLENAASMTGFSSMHHLSKAFSKHFGMSVRKYRETTTIN